MLTEVKTFDAMLGDDINNIIPEAIAIAKRDHCIVKFSFNDVKFNILWFSNVKEELEKYSRGL